MTKITSAFTLLVCLFLTHPAMAQAVHTFVSGARNDSNPCTFAQTCRTIQIA